MIVEIPINKPKRKNANLEPNIVIGDRKINGKKKSRHEPHINFRF